MAEFQVGDRVYCGCAACVNHGSPYIVVDTITRIFYSGHTEKGTRMSILKSKAKHYGAEKEEPDPDDIALFS